MILVSGRAGTGKSRLIRYIAGLPEGSRTMIVAPTGIAALNIGASTIHAAFQIPHAMVDARSMQARKLGPEIRKIDRLIVDEVSMVRADLLDAIDARLRDARKLDRPFGGVQVMLVGDFLQLPPVVRDDDMAALAGLGYRTPYAFSAHVMQEVPLKVITLTKVWRQSDAELIEMLGRIREGRRTQEALAWLNARCSREARAGSQPMLLTPTRAAADRYNDAGLARLKATSSSAPVISLGLRQGSFVESAALPAPETLALLPGLRVMATKNGVGYVNGSLGVVTEIDTSDPEALAAMVSFDGATEPVKVSPATWENTRSEWKDGEGLVNKVIGRYQQIPLALGYAITIHKSQGLTLEDVRLDLGRGTFAPGQAYVALSRAKHLEGLSFARPLNTRDVRTDAILDAFLAWTRESDGLEVTVAKS